MDSVYKLLLKAVFTLFLTLAGVAAHGEIVIITHPDNSEVFTDVEIRKIFLGRISRFQNGQNIHSYELTEGNSRKQFLRQILLKDEARLATYWSRMIFSGKGLPPKIIKSERMIKQIVSQQPGAISYIDRKNADSSVRIITLKELGLQSRK